MPKHIKSERRLSPRIDQKLPVNIAADEYAFSTYTKNVSSTGTYCHINKYIPPFTKLALKLILPVRCEGVKEEFTVDCKGVIVRVDDDEIKGGFNIAIFFNEINDTQRANISRYIAQFLPNQHSAALYS